MRSISALLFVVGLLSSSACGGARPAPRAPETASSATHRVVLHRPFHEGQRFRYEASARQRTVVVAGSLANPAFSADVTSVLELVALESILGTNASGQATWVAYELEKLEVRVGEERRFAATPGQRLEIVAGMRARDVVLTIDARPVPPEVHALLLLVLETTQAVHTDDHLFGTLAPQAVGSWWSIDSVRVNEAFLLTGLYSGLGDVTGATTLEGVEDDLGVACSRIATDLRIDGVVPKERIPSFTLTGGGLSAHLSACYPIDPNLHPRVRTAQVDYALRGRVRAPNGYVEARMESRVETTTTRVAIR